jgi:hypothetical protein
MLEAEAAVTAQCAVFVSLKIGPVTEVDLTDFTAEFAFAFHVFKVFLEVRE